MPLRLALASRLCPKILATIALPSSCFDELSDDNRDEEGTKTVLRDERAEWRIILSYWEQVSPLCHGTRWLKQVDAEQLEHTTSGHCEVVA